MKRRRYIAGLLLASYLALGAGCTSNYVSVQRLDVEVEDNLSASVAVIAVEQDQDIQRQVAAKATPSVDALRSGVAESCPNAQILPFSSVDQAHGFRATFVSRAKGDLPYALSCIPSAVLNQYVTIQPLSVAHDVLGSATYELEIDLAQPRYFREVQVRLPGNMEEPPRYRNKLASVVAVPTPVAPDTVRWAIVDVTPAPALLTAVPEAVQSYPTALAMRAQGVALGPDQLTAEAVYSELTAPDAYTISLVARSHTPIDWLNLAKDLGAILAGILGGGWMLSIARRLAKRNSPAGGGAPAPPAR